MPDLRAVADLVRLVVFLAFMLLALRAARAMRGSGPERRKAVGVFVAFTVLVSMAVGVAQHAAWPFSHWPMDNKYFEAETTGLLPFVVDAGGEEHELDFRALYPLTWMDLYDWLSQTRQGHPEAFADVAPWLVRRIAEARRQLERTGRMPGDRWALAAPVPLVVPPLWTPDDGLSPLAVTGLRIYEFTTNLDEPPSVPAPGQRTLIFEYPAQ
ncbi:MAG: hypothetical protein HKM89_06885 [Gemmatimonadales bacterium]|nr:hypothetical protein [Gemmatimonadales bacterium]